MENQPSSRTIITPRKYKVAALALVMLTWWFLLRVEGFAGLSVIIFPNSSWSHMGLADVYMEHVMEAEDYGFPYSEYEGFLGRAIQEYQAATILAPNSAEAHYKYGIACSGSRDFPVSRLALQEYELAVSLEPNNVEFLFELASQLYWSGRKEEALQKYKKIVSLAATKHGNESLTNLAQTQIQSIAQASK